MLMMRDFSCPECGCGFEALVDKEDEHAQCISCGAQADKIISAPHIARLNDPILRSEALKKRSEQHTLEMHRKNPEKLAKLTGGKPRAQNRWNLRGRGK